MLRGRACSESVEAIQRDLIIRTGKHKGRNLSLTKNRIATKVTCRIDHLLHTKIIDLDMTPLRDNL
ncbi:hypothetical protein LWC34_30405 [Kibdelosporangium philippinense]|uniref:Uncharacterized protein n=1 Tax=Kibdelosporangium philippinense TaxID=211113 RepID=A0ABS8ZJ10_9PSEU|nr:hypothetical protein [Kibdelosporangium philippinense]MCE7007108.1 hypothetical protein [Kibdelosporangium philippinense]